MQKTIYFLAYLNRSGSTLLAKKLNEFKDIAVGIEFKLSSDIKENFYANTEKELNYWLDKIYLDKKFQSWNVDRSELKNHLLKLNRTIRFNDFLKTALTLYFKNDPAKILIHKDRYYLNKLDIAEKLFPGSKHIFIDRDPRAIFNSQKKSIDSTTKKTMQNNIVQFALGYKRNQQRIKHYLKSNKYKDKLLVIRYENLLQNEYEELNKILRFFSVSEMKEHNFNYFDKIPEEQKHLHTKLNSPNDKKRIDAWNQELSENEIGFLEFVLKLELNYHGYNFTSNLKIIKFLKSHTFLKNILIFIWKFYPKHLVKIILFRFKLRKVY